MSSVLKILKWFSANVPPALVVAGVIFVFLGVFEVNGLKSFPVRSPVAWAPIVVGSVLCMVGLAFWFWVKRQGTYEEITELFGKVTPPNLLFLAVAQYCNYPHMHGDRVAELRPKWRHGEDDWKRQTESMVKLGLLSKNLTGEVERTSLGTAVVFLALKKEGFGEVAEAVKSDTALANWWGLSVS